MNKSTHFSGHPIIKQLLNLIPKGLVRRTAEAHDSNRYYKSFKTYEHMVCMLYATLSGVSSLRELSTVMLACEGKLSHLELSSFPKRSTLSDANMKRNSNVFADIYYGLLNQYGSFLSDSDIKGSPVKHLNIVDSSTISLFCDILKGVGRNPINGKKKGGIKMHTMINALQDVPCLIRFSSAATHDHTFLKELNLQKGSFVVFDKAYNDYTQYLQWIEQDIYFVTRQKDNAHYEHIDELDIEDHIDDNVLRDEIIEIKKNEQIISLRRLAYWDNEKKKPMYSYLTTSLSVQSKYVIFINVDGK